MHLPPGVTPTTAQTTGSPMEMGCQCFKGDTITGLVRVLSSFGTSAAQPRFVMLYYVNPPCSS